MEEFQVVIEIIQTFCSNSTSTRKEFNIQNFLDNYPSTLNSKRKKKIKQYFIDYLQLLNKQNKVQDKFIDLVSKDVLDISQLKTSHLNIAVFENLDIKFI